MLSGHTSTNLLEGWNGGHGEDRRTGLTEGQEALWQALVPTGGQPAPHLAERLGLDLHETQADLRCLERRGLANRDAEGLWWRTYL